MSCECFLAQRVGMIPVDKACGLIGLCRILQVFLVSNRCDKYSRVTEQDCCWSVFRTACEPKTTLGRGFSTFHLAKQGHSEPLQDEVRSALFSLSGVAFMISLRSSFTWRFTLAVWLPVCSRKR